MRELVTDENPVKDFREIYADTFVNLKEKISAPPIVLSMGEYQQGSQIYDNSFGTEGNFSAITGAGKSRKSYFKSLLVASYIGGQSSRYADQIKPHRTEDKLIYDFDTEQSKWHSQMVFGRVGKIVGRPYKNYLPFSLRQLPHHERVEFIDWLIYKEQVGSIGLIVIDGIADLVSDVNNLQECNAIVQKLMEWTDYSKAHLIGVIHTNFDSGKPTGHLGSAVIKKAETVCFLKKEGEQTTVEFKQTRGFPIDSFGFRIDRDGLPKTHSVEQELY